MNRGTRNDIMELMQEHALPALVDLFLRVAAAGKEIHRGQPLRQRQLMLHMAVHLLIVRLRCVGAAMILQIKLAIPDRHVPVGPLHIFMHFPEKRTGCPCLHMRQSRRLIHGAAHHEHFPVHTAASIAITVSDQRLPAQIFVAELLPASKNGAGRHMSTVSGEPIRHSPSLIRRVDKIREHLRTVDAPPPEQIIWNGVVLVPADLGGHECVNLAEL